MNREVQFRGQSVDTGEWLYGDILSLNEHFLIAPHKGDWYDFMPPKSRLGLPSGKYEVKPKTVGEYTGLTDIDGKKIYEGDIVESKRQEIHTVFSVPGGFAIESNPKIFGFGNTPIECLCDEQNSEWFQENFKVIGNIHDNPELLKLNSEI